jgi:hypothetical protein
MKRLHGIGAGTRAHLAQRPGLAFACLVLACLAGAPAVSTAQDARLTATAAPPIDLSGFIDIAVAGDATSRSSSFALSEFEIDVKKSFADIASFRVDLNFRFADALDGNGQLTAPNYDRLLEQAFVTIDVLKKRTGLTFSAGKFNAPIGFEALDPPDRLQISLSNVFSYLLPFNVLGGMVAWERGPVTLVAHVTKGWDLLVDNNSSLTFGGRLGLTLAGGVANLGLSALWGPEGPRDGDARTVVDLDFTLKLWDKLTLGFELNFGTQPHGSGIAPGERASWFGLLSTIHWRWRDWLASTLRYDVVRDRDGAMVTPGTPQTRHALTLALLIALSQGKAPFGVATGAMAAIEYRGELADAGVFTRADGTLGDTRHVLAAKMIYAW